jgi:hypothetical protein
MPATITLGHLLVAMGIADALVAALLGVNVSRNEGHSPGTPQYARARAAKRTALVALASAVVLVLLGLLTPLGDIVLIGEGA